MSSIGIKYFFDTFKTYLLIFPHPRVMIYPGVTWENILEDDNSHFHLFKPLYV